jgi:hypothetical protein
MKKQLLVFLLLIIPLLESCDIKETILTNMVHRDGSITRKVTVRTNLREKLNFQEMEIPMDSTWKTEINWKKEQLEEDSADLDTVWYLTAEKHFENVKAINSDYQNDNGINSSLKRKANFSKSFKWFTTVYRYSEKVDKLFLVECPMSEFFSVEETEFTYLPSEIQESLLASSDSLKYQPIAKKVEDKLGDYLITVMIREWIYRLYELIKDHPDFNMSLEEMLLREKDAVDYTLEENEQGDNPFYPEMELAKIIFGEDFNQTFQQEIQNTYGAMEASQQKIDLVSDYQVETRMPGRILRTNGYLITDQDIPDNLGVRWTVGPFIVWGEDYEMWVESRENNYSIWAFTGLFLLFAVMGFYRKYKKIKV